MRRDLRVGIIGTGFMGTVHARAVSAAGATLAGVAGSSLARAEGAQRSFGAERAFASAQELIESPDVDVVHICTPNGTHHDFAGLALDAGKHVVCEKPLDTGAEGAQHLADQATAAGVVAAVPFAYRFYPTVRMARAQIAAGALGRVNLVHGSYLQDWLAGPSSTNWRVDPALGGPSRAFADIGVHWCDLFEFTTGQRIQSVSARSLVTQDRRGAGAVTTEDVLTVHLETDAGALGSVVISQVAWGRKNAFRITIEGEAGAMGFDQEHPDELTVSSATGINRVSRGGAFPDGSDNPYDMVPPGHPQGYQDCFNAFASDTYAAIEGHAPDGLPTFADGARAAWITQAVIESARNHTWTQVKS